MAEGKLTYIKPDDGEWGHHCSNCNAFLFDYRYVPYVFTDDIRNETYELDAGCQIICMHCGLTVKEIEGFHITTEGPRRMGEAFDELNKWCQEQFNKWVTEATKVGERNKKLRKDMEDYETKRKNLIELYICPQCRTDSFLEILETRQLQELDIEYQVRCANCHCSTKPQSTEDKAIYEWNLQCSTYSLQHGSSVSF